MIENDPPKRYETLTTEELDALDKLFAEASSSLWLDCREGKLDRIATRMRELPPDSADLKLLSALRVHCRAIIDTVRDYHRVRSALIEARDALIIDEDAYADERDGPASRFKWLLHYIRGVLQRSRPTSTEREIYRLKRERESLRAELDGVKSGYVSDFMGKTPAEWQALEEAARVGGTDALAGEVARLRTILGEIREAALDCDDAREEETWATMMKIAAHADNGEALKERPFKREVREYFF